MGWYLKKSFAIGPLRLNLSKSGLGASVGVKGLRVSTGPKGAQVNAGREGLYYRASLNTQPKRPVGALPPGESDISSAQDRTNEPSQADVADAIVGSGTRAVASSVGRQLGNQLIRGIFGGLFRGR